MFEEQYQAFKSLMKKWITLQVICDIIFIIVAVFLVMNEKMLLFGIVFALYFILKILVIKGVFHSVKNFTTYLNLKGRYSQAFKNNSNDLSIIQSEITVFMEQFNS